jgi:hypothetical protein
MIIHAHNTKRRSSSKSKRRPRKPVIINTQIPSKYWKIRFSSIFYFVVACATIVGGIAGTLYLLPDISVTPQVSTELPNQPFVTHFSLVNEGTLLHISIYHIAYQLGPPFNSEATIFSSKNYLAKELTPHENFTIGIPFPQKGFPLAGTNLVIIVVYRPWLLWQNEKYYKFRIIKDSQGLWTWLAQSHEQ